MKMKNILKLTFLLIAIVAVNAQAQDDDLFEMTLEDLMQIDIYSVSKKSESLFEAPLSSSTLTKEEIYNSGANSIPEALRLIPGLIVREITNGVYDVHLRGFDNITRYGDGTSSTNQITLVMVDGRPVFNNNLGGTYWEAIPVDLIDVERIEVVRGPSAPLYGPNAVAGVINIITKDVDKEGVIVDGNFAAGTDNTQVGGLRLGYQFNDKVSAQLSGNIQLRDRQDDSYFSYMQNDYVKDTQNQFEQALDKKGLNFMLDYKVDEDFNIGLQTGLQRADVAKVYRQNGSSPLSNSSYESQYVNLTFNKSGLAGRLSYVSGVDNLSKESTTILLKYDYENIEANLEYTLNISDKLSLRPGFNYQSSSYDDTDYFNPLAGTFGVLGDEKTIESYAGSLMADFRPTDNLRIVGGGRMDKFNSPDDAYFSYEFATTYNINENNIVRFVVSKSNSGSFIGPNFVNIDLPPTTYYAGNNELDLFRIQLFELGYRTKIGNNLEFNVELFRQQAENANALVAMIPQAPYGPGAEYFEYTNLPTTSTQNGVTVSANYVPSTNIQFKPFVTFQKTTSEDVPSSLSIIGLNDLQDVDNDQTPTVYGGFYFNVKATDKLTLNLSPYYMSQQEQYSFYDNLNPANTAGSIDAKFILNAKINYSISKNFNIYINGRNLLNDDSTEFYGADRTSTMLLGGLNIKL